MDPKDKARALIAFADGPLETLFQQSPTLLNDLPFNSTEEMYVAGSKFVGMAGDWLAEANSVLSELDERDPDRVIDELGLRVDRIAPRRALLMARGFGKQWAPGAFRDEMYKEIEKILNHDLPIAALVILGLVVLYLVRGR